MPYRSKAQQKWMHANHPKIAKKWDKITDFNNLPDRVEEDAMLETDLGSKPWSPKESIKNLGKLKKPLAANKEKTVSRLRNKHTDVIQRHEKPWVAPENRLQEDAFLSDQTAENTIESEPVKSKAPDTKEPKKPTGSTKSAPLDTNKKSPTPSTDAKGKKFVIPKSKSVKGGKTPQITDKSPTPVTGKKTLSLTEQVRGLIREVLTDISAKKKVDEKLIDRVQDIDGLNRSYAGKVIAVRAASLINGKEYGAISNDELKPEKLKVNRFIKVTRSSEGVALAVVEAASGVKYYVDLVSLKPISIKQ